MTRPVIHPEHYVGALSVALAGRIYGGFMVEELKPCPFCGAVTSIKASWGYFYIEANHKKPCGFAHTTGGFGPFASEKNAITAWNTREASVAAAVAERDAQIAALEARCEALAGALDGIPAELREHILEFGRVEWGATAEKTAADHIADFENSLRLTREHFNYDDVPVQMHGVYIEGSETVMAHTGTSPNSGTRARIMAGLWNHIHDQLAALAQHEGKE